MHDLNENEMAAIDGGGLVYDFFYWLGYGLTKGATQSAIDGMDTACAGGGP